MEVITLVRVLCEAAIAAVLVWKHTGLFDFTVPTALVVLSPALLVGHFAALKREGVPKEARLILGLLTGPCVLLTLSLVLSLGFQLKAVAIAGGATKEMALNANSEGVTASCVQQWTNDTVTKMKSERMILLLLGVSLCLNYGTRLRCALDGRVAKGSGESAMRTPT